MSEFVPLISVACVGVAFAAAIVLRPRLWRRWFAVLLCAAAFGVAILVATLPIVTGSMRDELSNDPFLPLTFGMVGGDLAFAIGVAIALTLPERAMRQA